MSGMEAAAAKNGHAQRNGHDAAPAAAAAAANGKQNGHHAAAATAANGKQNGHHAAAAAAVKNGAGGQYASSGVTATAARPPVMQRSVKVPAGATVKVASADVTRTDGDGDGGDETIETRYEYQRNRVTTAAGGRVTVTPERHEYRFRTAARPRRTGVLFVGWGGNNGSTLTGGLLANRLGLRWRTKDGERAANYYGSVTQATTVQVGTDDDGHAIYVPFRSLLPMLEPDALVVGGWDINGATLADAMERAAVFDVDLQRQLREHMAALVPMRAPYYEDFIAANQAARADNVLGRGDDKQADLDALRADIRRFRAAHELETVIVLWTANTERFVDVRDGLNTRADDVLAAIARSDPELAPSQLFAVAAALEGCAYINGSPQNTLTPGVVELAERCGTFVGGDDFKSGQTKVKSALVEFLVGAGIKPRALVSYNHLGNNDGKNLNAPKTFRSKEISKASVVDDMVASNHLLYGGGVDGGERDAKASAAAAASGEQPDHVIVIKYVPTVGDSKRAMDEYTSAIFMGGAHTLVMHNTCEDSLLAAPIMLDLVVLTELFSRITYANAATAGQYRRFDSVLSVLAYLCKAPLVNAGTPTVNALGRQQRALTNIVCAAAGIPPDSDMMLEAKTLLPPAMD